jgi:hypothetical protein
MKSVVKTVHPVTGTGTNDETKAPSPAAADDRLRAEVAVYIAQMAAEMAGMARSARLDLLAYFLDMARIEANGQRQTRM